MARPASTSFGWDVGGSLVSSPGRTVFARGRVGVHDDRLAIYNPWYELRGLS